MEDTVKVISEESGIDEEKVKQGIELAKDKDFAEGMKELQKIPFAIGGPAARFILLGLINYGCAPEDEKRKMIEMVHKASEDIGHGSTELKFPNASKGGKPRSRYIMLDECPKDFDFGKELSKVLNEAYPQTHKQIKDEIAKVVAIGRFVYANIAHNNPELMQKIQEYLGPNEKILNKPISVDMKNTTLFVLENLDKRVGIYLRTQNEKDRKNKKKK